MTATDRLEALVRTGVLHREEPDTEEIEGLIHSARIRLQDADTAKLSFESRFDLVYNASHALALAAMRRLGYRPRNRAIVFQALGVTAGLEPPQWRVLSIAHDCRNAAEYEGVLEPDEALLENMVAIADLIVSILTAD